MKIILITCLLVSCTLQQATREPKRSNGITEEIAFLQYGIIGQYMILDGYIIGNQSPEDYLLIFSMREKTDDPDVYSRTDTLVYQDVTKSRRADVDAWITLPKDIEMKAGNYEVKVVNKHGKEIPMYFGRYR